MITALANRLRADRQGSSIVEFALTFPMIAALIFGALALANYLYVQNTLDHAVDETARCATISPGASLSQLRTCFDNNLTARLQGNLVQFSAVKANVTDKVLAVTVSADYPVPLEFVFWSVGSLTAKAHSTIYVRTAA